MQQSPCQRVLAEELATDTFVRRGLAALEAELHELSLLALAAWDATGVVSPGLFSAVAALQRPSWGNWNGVLLALRAARREVLQKAPPEARSRVEASVALAAILNLYERRLTESERTALAPLAGFLRMDWGTRPRVAELVALPIALVLALLIGCTFASVHHAETLAHRLGALFGSLVLALAISVIEAGLIVSMMLAGDQPELARDSFFSALLIALNGNGQVQPGFWLNPQAGIQYLVNVRAPERDMDSLEALGAIPVPLYQDAVAAEMRFVMEDAEIAFAFA